MVRRFFITIRLIWQGWRNYVLDIISDIKYKMYFDERYEICKMCWHNSKGICQKCGCVIKAKTMAEDAECPIGLWKTIPETLKENGKEQA